MDIKFNNVASEAEVADRRRAALDALRDARVPRPYATKDTSPTAAENASPYLSVELRSYLKLIQDNPGTPATKRDDAAGTTRKKGSTLRTRLRQLGLIEEYWTAPGTKGEMAIKPSSSSIPARSSPSAPGVGTPSASPSIAGPKLSPSTIVCLAPLLASSVP